MINSLFKTKYNDIDTSKHSLVSAFWVSLFLYSCMTISTPYHLHAFCLLGIDNTPNLMTIEIIKAILTAIYDFAIKKLRSWRISIWQMESHGMDLDMLGSAVASSGMTVSPQFSYQCSGIFVPLPSTNVTILCPNNIIFIQVLPTSMADCVSSPHHIHPSMSMYNTHGGMMSPHTPLTHHPHHSQPTLSL